MQVTFQAVLATDGRTSFAIFNFDSDLDSIVRIDSDSISTGFDAGDKMANLIPNRLDTEVEVFRIDGMWGKAN